MTQDSERSGPTRVYIVGLGGIGSSIVDNLIPVLDKIGLDIELTLMDSDIVESNNLGHQRFLASDIGKSKVGALKERFSHVNVEINAIEKDLLELDELSNAEYVVVCVDNPEARRIVHQLQCNWLDLRCSGDGFVMFSNHSEGELVEMMTPDHPRASCQHEGAIEGGNIEFGYLLAATHGLQWLVQNLRSGLAPKQRMASLTHGEFTFPQVSA